LNRPLPRERLPALDTTEGGLATAQAAERRRLFGANDLLQDEGRAWAELARDALRDPMIWLLVGTGALYALLGNAAEAATLLAAVAPLLGMDVFLHRRTQSATRGLGERLAVRARVWRDGVLGELPARELVPGDLAEVGAGETFPADGLIVGGRDLQADESSLTGEAYPVPKRRMPGPPAGGPIDAEHWGHAGTRLLTGGARLLVAFTGAETLYGEIARLAAASARARTPLQQAMARLVSALVAVAVATCALLAAVRLAQGHGWLDALLSGLTLAVAAIPEEFPVAFTFFLGLGVYRLARRRALVRRAVCVETIGRVTVVCADKTGTLTEGRLRLAALRRARVPDERLLGLAALASRADSYDPLDAAVLERAPPALPDRLRVFPFTEGRRRETAIAPEDGGLIAATKGAPETVLDGCDLPPAEAREWMAWAEREGARGYKVLAVAWRPVDGPDLEPPAGYRLAGLLLFEDPVRAGVAQAVAECARGGVRTLMLTGDHAATAGAVAEHLRLSEGPLVLRDGAAVAAAARVAGACALDGVHAVYRALPAHKLEIVDALARDGEVVAVTGDGVNDVPALQRADVGIAMGERGTRAARDAADIVLLDDDFNTIVRAMGEGRQLLDNLKRSFAYLIAIHVPLVGTAAAVPLLGFPLLYLPLHVAWLELLIHPTAMLVFQNASSRDGLGARRQRSGLFSGGERAGIVLTGLALAAAVGAAFLAGMTGAGGSAPRGRALALATLTLGSAACTAVLSRLQTGASRVAVAGTVALSVAALQVPAAAARLAVAPLAATEWLVAAAAALAGALPLLSFQAPPRAAFARERARPWPPTRALRERA
jgi:Ca2+-transporting ATPase